MLTQNDLALLQAVLEFFMANAPLDDEDGVECDKLIDKLIDWSPEPELEKQETITVVVHIDPWAGKTLTPDEFEERVRDAVKRAIYP